MKVLVVGSGGREHAIVDCLARSKRVDRIVCAPGNAGIAEVAECVDIGAMELHRLADYAKKEGMDLTVIGMDDPLGAGIVDVFEERGLRVFGPRKRAAMIESSKVFSKNLMKRYGIPTAEFETFDSAEKASDYLRSCKYPVVLKADGLAAGKGVLISKTMEEAEDAVKTIMMDKAFGLAGERIVIEEYMTGPEVSVLCYCDGTHIAPMTSAQDHKRAKDNDEGLNTGGMGTFSPTPFYTEEVRDFCETRIFQPTMDAMKQEGRDFVGVLFVGLMLTDDGPRVLEYNARFGDPEAQVVLPRMKNDIIDVIEACMEGRLNEVDLEFEDNAAVCVMLASKGYPLAYEKGKLITGLEKFKGKDGYYAFHSGTKRTEQGVVTDGGRVLGITAKGKDLIDARENAYEATKWVWFENKYMRNDIGKSLDQWNG